MKPVAIFMLAAAATMTCGCGKRAKFTRVRYELVHRGMHQDQVLDTLGAPAETTSDRWTYVNEMPFCSAVIRFEDGRVVGKSWSIERPTEPDGDKPPGPQ